MSDSHPTTPQQLPANLAALQQDLKQMAASVKPSAELPGDKQAIIGGPVLVIRGK
jgi:hypothetical protein